MVEREQQNSVVILRMKHGKANALDPELCGEIAQRLREEEDSSAKAVVLTGFGSIFSAGLDLIRVLEEGTGYIRRLLPLLRDFWQEIFVYPKPLVMALNGHAVAGGCVLACMADLRLMADGPCQMGMPEFLPGLPFPPTPIETLRFVIPRRFLAEVVYSGGFFSPLQAQHRGLIDGVVDSSQLLGNAIRAADELASIPTELFTRAKRTVRGRTLERMRRREAEMGTAVEALWSSQATFSAIEAHVRQTMTSSIKVRIRKKINSPKP